MDSPGASPSVGIRRLNAIEPVQPTEPKTGVAIEAATTRPTIGSANRPITLKIAERMGMPADKFQLDFFGGTMFWVRPEALKPLRDLHLGADMPYEGGLIDGDLPHALERVLPTSVLVAGYKLADSESYQSIQARGATTGITHSTEVDPLAASGRA
jgi:lipopolysaccharide biosynthesis protein